MEQVEVVGVLDLGVSQAQTAAIPKFARGSASATLTGKVPHRQVPRHSAATCLRGKGFPSDPHVAFDLHIAAGKRDAGRDSHPLERSTSGTADDL